MFFVHTANCKGFTIIELMIALALVGVFITMGVPAFSGLMERNQLTTGINTFVSSLSIARSEAIKRNQRVSLCASNDGEQCADTGYENGWIVYVDSNQSDSLDDDDEIIWVNSNLSTNFTLRATSALSNQITYMPTGRIGASTEGNVKLCKDNDISKARMLIMIRTGRVQLANHNDDGVPMDNSDNLISNCNFS
ncbi:MAG: GspH/FimT family pseudopilin [Pseudomonadota bacterium]